MAKKASKVGIVVAIAGVLAVAALAVNIGRNVQEQAKEATQTFGSEDFVLDHYYVRTTSDMTESDGLKIAMQYRLSPEKASEILSAENKVAYVLSLNYKTRIEPFLNQGYTYEETMKAALSARAESAEMSLNEFLLYVYDTVKNADVEPGRVIDEYGEAKEIMMLNATGYDSYDRVNERFFGMGLILTNDNGQVSYEVGSLGGKSLSDMEVSPSMAYLSSMYLNHMYSGGQAYNATVTNLCREAVNKACAQASGYTEEEYESGVEVGAPIKSGTTITMKVGETKQFIPEQLIDVQLHFYYYLPHWCGTANNAQGYAIDGVGNITALKAGTYEVAVRCAEKLYRYTLNITE